jgi:lipopolysaccharide assembly outer membrane protein LptD (OstA)
MVRDALSLNRCYDRSFEEAAMKQLVLLTALTFGLTLPAFAQNADETASRDREQKIREAKQKHDIFAAVVAALGARSRAQDAQSTGSQTVSLSLTADTLSRTPKHGYDGVVRVGSAEHVITASGDVVIVINGTRVTADTFRWDRSSNVIELNGGSIRLELPAPPSSFDYTVRP